MARSASRRAAARLAAAGARPPLSRPLSVPDMTAPADSEIWVFDQGGRVVVSIRMGEDAEAIFRTFWLDPSKARTLAERLIASAVAADGGL